MLVSSLWDVNIAPQKGINRRLALWTNKCIDIAYRIWVYTYISIGNLKAANCIHKTFAKSQNKNNHWSLHPTFEQSTRVFSHLPSSDDLWNSRKGPSEFHTILRFDSLLSFTLFPDSGEPPFSPQLLIKMNSYKTSFHKICTIKNNVQKDQEIREAKREEEGRERTCRCVNSLKEYCTAATCSSRQRLCGCLICFRFPKHERNKSCKSLDMLKGGDV